MNTTNLISNLTPGLMLVHGNQAESLRDLLVQWMQRYALAPLENEVVLVQSNGIAQWLKLALAAAPAEGGVGGGGCGVAAATEFLLPSRFLWQVYRAVLGGEAVPEVSPFDKPRLVWRLMRLLPALVHDPVYAPLARFLDHDDDLRKRFQLAGRLADLYDQYQVYRADWLAVWAEGQDVLIAARGERTPLEAGQQWQAALWRALLADVGTARAGRAAVHEAFLQRVAGWDGDSRPTGLPRRVMVFGISSLPRQSLEVLAALGRWTQVLMCVQNPCEHYWADIVAGKELLRAQAMRQRRRPGMPEMLSDDDMHAHAHPLLAAWGKQGRDFIALLDEHDRPEARGSYAPHFAALGQRIDLFSAPAADTLLAQLQDDIRDLRALPDTREHWGAVVAGDESICFHVAHGPQREVEVLHDQLLAAFNADPTLRPRDVIVMVPDIDTYAPHIQAVFGLLDTHDPRYIPFNVADQGRRQVDPLVHAIELLLALPRSRVSVSNVLDLLEVPALRTRFGIAEDDLPLLHRWIRGANVRWGLHAEQRASLGLPHDNVDAAHNSWAFGLRRMLLGYAVGHDAEAWQGIEPYGEPGGLGAAALGPLVLLLECLETTWRSLSTPAPVQEWCERLRALMADFFVAGDSDDAWTLLQLDGALQHWLEASDEAALDESLPLSIVGEHWLSCLDEHGLSQRFFGGAVTFATLMPMRAIPFRQVCLLGMNDGDFPRTRIGMDFDLMGHDYRPGDRSRREDDRYLFLEALLSARQRLYISWVGRSIHDNSPRPPSVLVGQLRDHLAAGWCLDGDGDGDEGNALLAALTVEHRLQAFSRDYFSPPPGSPLFTYAHEWHSAPASNDAAGNGDAVLPPLQREEPLSLAELIEFVKGPVRAFFRQRLGVRFEAEDPSSEDIEPFVLDGLENWALQNELIQAQVRALLAHEDIEEARNDCLGRMQRRGELALGGWGAVMSDALAAPMDELFQHYAEALERWPEAAEQDEALRFTVDVDGLPFSLADWIVGLRSNAQGARGRVVLESSNIVKNKKYRPEKLISHWVTHLAAHVAGGPLTTEIISKVGSVTLRPLTRDDARAHLTTLLEAWHEGMHRPLPLAVETAFAWLKVSYDPKAIISVAPAASGTHAWNEDESISYDKATSTARVAYHGGYKLHSELENNLYLQRAWPSYEALTASGEFVELTVALLRPLQQAIFAKEDAATANGGASA